MLARARDEGARHREVENRLRDHELGAGLRFALQQFVLALEGFAIGIGDRADRELRKRLEQAAPFAGIAAAQFIHRTQQAERVEVMDRTRAAGIGGQFVAGQRDHGVDAERSRRRAGRLSARSDCGRGRKS